MSKIVYLFVAGVAIALSTLVNYALLLDDAGSSSRSYGGGGGGYVGGFGGGHK